MYQEISNRLANAIEKRRLRDKLERNLGEVQDEIERETSRLRALEGQLSQEKADLEKMERLSLSALFYTVLGSREEQTEKERQEFLSAQLKYQKAKFLLTSLESEREHLIDQLEGLKGIDQEYEALLSEKEALLRADDQDAENELAKIDEQAANLKAETRELEEALRAGKEVSAGLKRVREFLESAHGWGVWDMVGGGLISTAIKHDRINQAREAVFAVQAQMSQFKRELADVSKSPGLEVELTAFESFADYFFDGLIIDWIVQSKITNSLEQTRAAQESIGKAIEELGDLLEQANEQIRTLNAKRKALIEGG